MMESGKKGVGVQSAHALTRCSFSLAWLADIRAKRLTTFVGVAISLSKHVHEENALGVVRNVF